MSRRSKPRWMVLITAAATACLLLVAARVFGAHRDIHSFSDPIPTAFAYLPIVCNGPTPGPPPVIHIWGRVAEEDDTVVGNVGIYVGMTCNPGHGGWLVTTTTPGGEYEADIACPLGHDETLRVYPERDGYDFSPTYDCWRTYGYCLGKETDFTAMPTSMLTP